MKLALFTAADVIMYFTSEAYPKKEREGKAEWKRANRVNEG